MLGGFVAVYRANLDCIVYVVGDAAQNELMLACALDTFYDVLNDLLKYPARHDDALTHDWRAGPSWTRWPSLRALRP